MPPIQSIGMQPSPFKGFLIRFLAFMIDIVVAILAILAVAIVFLIFFDSLFGIEAGFFAAFIMIILAGLAAQFIYKPLMEASEYQGTIGKIALSMKVVDKHGRRITMAKSFIRTIVYIIEHAILEGLNDLSSDRAKFQPKPGESGNENAETHGPAAEDNGEPVGGHTQEVVA